MQVVIPNLYKGLNNLTVPCVRFEETFAGRVDFRDQPLFEVDQSKEQSRSNFMAF
jgi:hypothetical protein